jgi:hypothetical protein
MSGGKGRCACVNCNMNRSSGAKRTATTQSTTRAQPGVESTTTASQRLRTFIKKVDENGEAFDPGMDHIAAYHVSVREDDKKMLAAYQNRPSFLPRLGEMVLFYEEHYPLMSYSENDQYELHTVSGNLSGSTSRIPPWKAGVVCEDLNWDKNLSRVQVLPSLIDKQASAESIMFRVDCLSDPDSNNKSLSHQSFRISASHIRPLSFFRELLSGFPQSGWHETIFNAFKSLTTCSLWGTTRLVGIYNISVYECQGIWIGAEHIVRGDAVRIMPTLGETDIRRIFVIDRIMCVINTFNEDDDMGVTRLRGDMYTIQPNKTGLLDDREQAALPKSMEGFTWYRSPCTQNFEAGSKDITSRSKWEISCDQVLGRMYSKAEMVAMLQVDDFNVSGEGMIAARSHCEKKSARCQNSWFFGVDRVEALGLELFNGLRVGRGKAREKLRKQISNRNMSSPRGSREAEATSHGVVDNTGRQISKFSDDETVDDEAAELMRETPGGKVPPSDDNETSDGQLMDGEDRDNVDAVEEYGKYDETGGDEMKL